jgi:hypothetical protein
MGHAKLGTLQQAYSSVHISRPYFQDRVLSQMKRPYTRWIFYKLNSTARKEVRVHSWQSVEVSKLIILDHITYLGRVKLSKPRHELTVKYLVWSFRLSKLVSFPKIYCPGLECRSTHLRTSTEVLTNCNTAQSLGPTEFLHNPSWDLFCSPHWWGSACCDSYDILKTVQR